MKVSILIYMRSSAKIALIAAKIFALSKSSGIFFAKKQILETQCAACRATVYNAIKWMKEYNFLKTKNNSLVLTKDAYTIHTYHYLYMPTALLQNPGYTAMEKIALIATIQTGNPEQATKLLGQASSTETRKTLKKTQALRKN